MGRICWGILSGVVATAVPLQRLKLIQTKVRNTNSVSTRTSTWDCLVDTGVPCKSSCPEWQGTAQCQDGSCVCSSGCVGVDGYCRGAKYQRANSTFKIRNSHWPSVTMALSSWSGALEVSSEPEIADSQWLATELPSNKDQHQGILLSTLSRPEHALSMGSRMECDPDNLDSCQVLWSASMQPITEPQVPVRSVAVLLQRAPGKLGDEGAVLIRPYVSWGGSHFLYVPRGSWAVSVSTGDPGPGGYWTLDPPMPGLVTAADPQSRLRGSAFGWRCPKLFVFMACLLVLWM